MQVDPSGSQRIIPLQGQYPAASTAKEEKKTAGAGSIYSPVISPPITVTIKRNITVTDPQAMIKADPVLNARIYQNPDLTASDKELLVKYYSAKVKGQDVSQTKKIIRSRMILLNSSDISGYTGKESISKMSKEPIAFSYALEALKVFDEPEFYKIAMESYKSYLSPSDETLIDNFRRHPGSDRARQAVLNKIQVYSSESAGAIWGTKEARILYQRSTAFSELAYLSGISQEELSYASMLGPNIFRSDDELLFYLYSFSAIGTPEKIDDNKYKDKMLKYLERSARDFFSCLNDSKPNFETISMLANRYMSFQEAAAELGIPRNFIIALEDRVKADIGIKPKPSSGDTKVVKPDDLPADVKALLQGTYIRSGYSYFQFLKENVEYIVLSSSEYVNASVKAMAGGSAGQHIADGVVYINMAGLDGMELSKNIYIFDVLLHEAYHAYMRKENFVNDPEKLRSVPNEGGAYRFEARALRALKQRGVAGTDTPEFKFAYQDAAALAESAGRSYSVHDRMKYAMGDYDLDIYPSNTPYYQGYTLAQNYLSAGLISDNEAKYYTEAFAEIILGQTALDDPPAKIAGLFMKLLVKADPKYAKMTYPKAINDLINRINTAYRSAGGESDLSSSAIINEILNCSVGCKVRDLPGKKTPIYNKYGQMIGTIPEGARLKYVIDAYNYSSSNTHVIYNGKDVYVSSEALILDDGKP